MDQRLSFTSGQRLQRLTRNENPDLARALVAYIRKQASYSVNTEYGLRFIKFTGLGIDIRVRMDDWLKIQPYFSDNTFNPDIVPVACPVVLHPEYGTDLSVLDRGDRELYFRILTVLNNLFTVEFPTSK